MRDLDDQPSLPRPSLDEHIKDYSRQRHVFVRAELRSVFLPRRSLFQEINKRKALQDNDFPAFRGLRRDYLWVNIYIHLITSCPFLQQSLVISAATIRVRIILQCISGIREKEDQ